MRCVAVIPARYGSSRLPGKPLADIHGKPMVQHVYERVMQVPGLAGVWVATDDQRIFDAVKGFGGQVVMTSAHHPSGTDRLAEVQKQVPADVYLNVQGDEPLISPKHLESLVQAMCAAPEVGMGSLCHAISAHEAESPNTVKVVVNQLGDALYFSRSKIPFVRDTGGSARYLKHVGVYAYRADVLAGFGALPHSELEAAESLEQLRLLDAGVRIRMVEVDHAAPGVDSPACLERVRALMAGLPDPASASLADVRLVITDIDGVLTDGSIWYDESGECLKRFHVRDGMGLRMLIESGVAVAVVSGRDSATLRKRLADLGVSEFVLNVKDKAAACHQLMDKFGVNKSQTAFIGDDSIDLPAFEVVGWPIAVPDAEDYVRRAARMVLSKPGGHGAFRDFADALLAATGKGDVYASVKGYTAVMNKMSQ